MPRRNSHITAKRAVQKLFSQKPCRESIELADLIRLWVFRLMVPLQGYKKVIEKYGVQDNTLAIFLGLGAWIDDEQGDFNQKAVLSRLRKNYQESERSLCDAKPPKNLINNVSRLSNLAGLSETDCRILEFTVLIHSENLLDEAADCLGQLSSGKVYHVLSILLDIPEQEIRNALSSKGTLACSGLVGVDRDGNDTLKDKLKLISDTFAETILYSDADPVTLFRDIIVPSRPTALTVNDFSHINPALKILLPYLRHTLETRRRGSNIFLYGIPGTGKSELCRLLAKEIACELFEVASEDNEGDPVGDYQRLHALVAAQSFFSRRRALILFDEVEDIFHQFWNRFFDVKGGGEQSRKAWINRMLENNIIPTIWVSNSADCMDQAFLRRFDMVIEIPIPPKRQRERIVRDACGGMLPEASVRRIAETEMLAPAIITRAVSVVDSIRGELEGEDIPSAVERLIGNTLRAQGHRSPKLMDSGLSETYDPAFINADTDPVALADGLAKSKSGRLCLYGPPGTGKTAFGKWLAERIEAPLCVKKASDLLSMYLGETEKNIAKAFLDAEQEGALLLIDEVDSFLRDRRLAQRSWEITEVNEMLTRMESFPGVFIASTNLVDGLDPASLRRFDLKVEFKFLKIEQAWMLLKRYCIALGLLEPDPEQKSRLYGLSILTPGDFAAVARQHRFRPIETSSAFIHALEQECLMKEEGRRNSVGFFAKPVSHGV